MEKTVLGDQPTKPPLEELDIYWHVNKMHNFGTQYSNKKYAYRMFLICQMSLIGVDVIKF